MRKINSTLKLMALAGMVALSGAAMAQQPAAFDGKKFFDEIASKGFSAPANFDAKKFFDELQQRGYSATNKLDGTKFFDEIASKGFKAPAGFDGRKFFEEQQKQSGQRFMPPMVDMAK